MAGGLKQNADIIFYHLSSRIRSSINLCGIEQERETEKRVGICREREKGCSIKFKHSQRKGGGEKRKKDSRCMLTYIYRYNIKPQQIKGKQKVCTGNGRGFIIGEWQVLS